jgi:hypothetical protein
MVYLLPMEKMRTSQNWKQLIISDLPKTERFSLWKTEGKGMEKGCHFLALEAKKDLELSTLLCNFATEYI